MSGVVCQIRIIGIVHLPLVLRIKSLWTPNKSGLWPEVYGWLGEYKVVLDKSGFSAYCVDGDWGLNFLSVGRHMFDRAGYVVDRLERLGLRSVSLLGRDTCAKADRFFSYRRTCLAGEKQFGCEISTIAIRD